jgi:hypothetical protein
MITSSIDLFGALLRIFKWEPRGPFYSPKMAPSRCSFPCEEDLNFLRSTGAPDSEQSPIAFLGWLRQLLGRPLKPSVTLPRQDAPEATTHPRPQLT